MKHEISVLSKETLVPISLVISGIGFVVWLTTMFMQGNANAHDIREIKAKSAQNNDKVFDELKEINRRLSNIEGKLSK